MSHKFGQVFLHDKNILGKIIQVSDLKPDDVAVEIGCGHGVLTRALADAVSALTIIEIDEACILATQSLMGDLSHVAYVHADILKDRFSSVRAEKFSVVANIPYYISAKILKLLIESRRRVDRAVLMVQREFAKKLIAKPGDKDYTSLTVHIRFYFDVEEAFPVSRTCFKPVPDVDSSVIILRPKKNVYDVDETVFFALVRSGFWGRRKPLVSALSKSPYVDLDKAYKESPFFLTRSGVRGEVLGLEEFEQLYRDISPFVKAVHGKHAGELT